MYVTWLYVLVVSEIEKVDIAKLVTRNETVAIVIKSQPHISNVFPLLCQAGLGVCDSRC